MGAFLYEKSKAYDKAWPQGWPNNGYSAGSNRRYGKICIIADSFASIENYKGVFECTESLIRLRTAYGIVRIEGENLSLGELRSERAVINGRVKSVAFEN